MEVKAKCKRTREESSQKTLRTQKQYYILDSSAYCRFVACELDPELREKEKDLCNIFRNLIFSREYLCYIPKFCIPEVFKTLARAWYRKDSDIKIEKEETYKKECSAFRDRIKERVFRTYDFHGFYYDLDCDEIFEKDFKKTGKKALSSIDTLVIKTAMELQKTHGKNNVKILAYDERLREIAGSLGIGVLPEKKEKKPKN
jgi:hypothetical protein